MYIKNLKNKKPLNKKKGCAGRQVNCYCATKGKRREEKNPQQAYQQEKAHLRRKKKVLDNVPILCHCFKEFSLISPFKFI